MNPKSKSRFLLCASGCVVIAALFSRISAVLYSTAATDILYSETVLPDVLTWLRQIFGAVSFGAGIAAVTAAAYFFGTKTAALTAGLYAAVLFADAAAAFLIDAVTGAVSPSLLLIAAMMNLGDWLVSAMLVLAVFLLTRRMAKRKMSEGRALLFSSLIYLCGRMILQLIYIVQFLIDVEFSPYSSEIVQMLGEVLQVLFIGGIVWLSSVGIHALLGRLGREKR